MTVAGGEPFQQPAALLALGERLDDADLTRLAFSGFTRGEIDRLLLGPNILGHLDVLTAGRAVETQRVGRGLLLGSANRQIQRLTPQHTLAEFRDIHGREVILPGDGSITLSGIAPWQVRRA